MLAVPRCLDPWPSADLQSPPYFFAGLFLVTCCRALRCNAAAAVLQRSTRCYMEGAILIGAPRLWRVLPLRRHLRFGYRCARWFVAVCCVAARLSYADDIAAPPPDLRQPITIAADACSHWRQGEYEVWHLRGNCYINQGLTYARAPEAVLWIADSPSGTGQTGTGPTGTGPTKVIAYLEASPQKQVVVDYRRDGAENSGVNRLGRQTLPSWLGRFHTAVPLRMQLPTAVGPSETKPGIYARGLEQFDPERRRQILLAQFSEFAPPVAGAQPLPPGMRRLSLFPRSDSLNEILWRTLPSGERVAVASGGIRLLVEGLSSSSLPGAFGPLGTIDISTDRAVIWASEIDSSAGDAAFQLHDAPLEIYMEGNIEFRQGDRIVYADRMFYDVRRQIGVVLNAELLTPLPNYKGHRYQGLVRLRAAAIRQLDESHFSATDALLTTSRLEEPSYHIGSGQIAFEDVQRPALDPLTSQPLIDPMTGEAIVEHRQLATSRGNRVYVSGIPLLYWPTIATDLSKPSFFIDRVRVGNDSVFGTQLMVDLDAYQLLGIQNAPAGTDWGVSVDYLSDRGVGWGTTFEYDRSGILGNAGPVKGIFDFWGIDDDGLDNLGLGRRAIAPEEDFRFRLFGQHRQRLSSGWEVTGEVGWTSDRTFLEQFYEQQWDEWKSPRTGLRLKRLADNRAFSIEANGQVNDFFTETQWLPRADHYWLGESLLGDRLTWFEHSQAAYADVNVATTPTNPTLAGQFTTLPWEADVEGERLVTRQEIDMPFSLGPVRVVPFALGELAQWGEVLDGDDLQRAFVHTGVRASVPFWSVFPEAYDPLFNVNGLAHKVVFDAEFSYADATRNIDELVLYDPLDDLSITEFRRRFMSGGLPPTILGPKFDPRFYAFRSGIQGWVTSPTTEIADDLLALRMGMRHRLQTKRGAPGQRHIVDWLTADFNVAWFPDQDRDNFGQDIGLVDYDIRWHLGDRFTILSDGAADFFGDGLRMVSAGVLINRPTRGNAYAGIRSISGPITSNTLLGSYSYRMSPKWISTASASVDLSDAGNIGQTFSITRIGESLLVTVGINVDEGKDNVGVNFMVEPRFLPDLRLTQRTGIEVPPAGAFGLE